MKINRLAVLLTLITSCFSIIGVGMAQADVEYAAVSDGVLTIYDAEGQSSAITNPPNRGIHSLAWSPSGDQLAYILVDEDFAYHLMTADTSGGEGTLLANAGRLETGFPVAWTPDGNILYAQSAYDPANPTVTYRVNIQQIAAEADAQPQMLGSIPFGVGCGGGSPLPSDWQYWTETGFGGSPLALQWTESGILFSIMCGGAGYGLLNPADGSYQYVTPVAVVNGMPSPEDNISRAKLSPDGTMLAAIRTVYAEPDPIESLVLIDLASGAFRNVPTTAQPDQVAWSASGDVYYSAREVADESLMDGLTAEQIARIEAMGTGFDISANRVTISVVDLQTESESILFTGDAHYVGRMVEADDGSLWFSLIPNLQAWLQAIGDGSIDPLTDVDSRQQLATVPVSIWQLDPAAGQPAQQRGVHLNSFALR